MNSRFGIMGKDLAAYNTKMFAEQGFAKAARHVQRMGRQMVAAANAPP
jgi:hypothetical protein